jgi:hypothetical protein
VVRAVRTIVITYLSEKDTWTRAEKMPRRSKADGTDVWDTTITSLAAILEEKGAITQAEWEQRIKKNLKS